MAEEIEQNNIKKEQGIIPINIEKEMKSSYLDYAMSVIVGRALPDVRDGLKPVHRRILFGMHELGMPFTKAHKKCARVVGDVLGKYHPHGDSSVYDALVRMGQDFSLRYPLVDGQGNFGSIDGDSPAAMRYTEARMAKISAELLQDIEKETVDYVENFDASLKEPTVLPSRIPNLLINGSSGIAVGMATNIPPHNLTEIGKALIAVVDNEDINDHDLLNIVQGPDFPTGAEICGVGGVRQAYLTGRGKTIMRAIIHEETKKDKTSLVATEIPYMVNKSELVIQIAEAVNDKKIEGIRDLRDESDRNGIRIVIDLKRDANAEVVKNLLYKYTRLQNTFGINTIALVNNIPKLLSLKDLLVHFIHHRVEVITRRTKYDLKKAQGKYHILEGLVKALDNIDKIIALIKKSKAGSEAKEQLIYQFQFSERQAQAILDMKLQRLTNMEQDKIRDELKSIAELIKELESILASDQKIRDIIKEETNELILKYGQERRTRISEAVDDIEYADLIDPEDVVITISNAGYIKRIPLSTYKAQNRGGVGIRAAVTKESDFIEHVFVANTHSYLLFFTNQGKVFWKKVYYIPEGTRQARGRAIINLIDLGEGEKVNAVIGVKEFNDNHLLLFATKNGILKKTSLKEYSRPRTVGIKAIKLDDGDEVVNVLNITNKTELLLATKNGQAVRFRGTDVRPMGRVSRGVKGIKLKGDDQLIGMVRSENNRQLLTITEHGYGKRTTFEDYRLINRGGSGVRNIVCSERNGPVVAIRSVADSDEIMVISKNGVIIRTEVNNISIIGRNTQGVRIMRLREGDEVVSVARIVNDDKDEIDQKEEPKAPKEILPEEKEMIEATQEDE